MNNTTDEELMELVKQHRDHAAMSELFHRRLDDVMRMCREFGGEAAEDLAQDVFMHVWEHANEHDACRSDFIILTAVKICCWHRQRSRLTHACPDGLGPWIGPGSSGVRPANGLRQPDQEQFRPHSIGPATAQRPPRCAALLKTQEYIHSMTANGRKHTVG